MIAWMLKIVAGNPVALLWIIGGAFAVGLTSGAGGAWTLQGWRLDAAKAKTVVVQGKFDAFVAQAKAIGDAQNARTAELDAANKQIKEKADRENAKSKSELAALYAKYRGLLNTKPGSHSGQLPPAASVTSSTPRTCFDTAKFAFAMGVLEAGVPGITEQGDVARLRLSTAAEWAASVNQKFSP